MRQLRRSRRRTPRRGAQGRVDPNRGPGRRARFPALGGLDRGGIALVIGLGNPGSGYRGTRHNAGRAAADRLMERAVSLAERKWKDGRLALVRQDSIHFLVLRPDTFMNLSGRAVAPVVRHYGLRPEQLIVMHDDIDIPFGEVRVKRGGGTGGHRGLVSLEESLGDSGFARVRIGVGRPPEGTDPVDYVLSGFAEEEMEGHRASIARATELALELASEVSGEAVS